MDYSETNPRYLATSLLVGWMQRAVVRLIGWGLGAPPLSGRFRGHTPDQPNHFIHKFDALIAYSQRGAVTNTPAGFTPEKIFVATKEVRRDLPDAPNG